MSGPLEHLTAGTPKIRGPGHSPGGHPGSPAPGDPGRGRDHSRAWTGTWATAQHASYDPGTSEVTVRIPVRVSAGGSSVRIRLTNGFTTSR